MRTSVLILAFTLVACAAPQTGPPLAGASRAATLADQKVNPCDYPAIYDCSSGSPIERTAAGKIDLCDPTVTDPYVFVECPARKSEAVVALARLAQQDEADAALARKADAANNAIAARNQADWLYCDMQGQMASNVADRGGLISGAIEGALAYDQIRRTCLQMKAAERAASTP